MKIISITIINILLVSWTTFGQTVDKKQYKATKITEAPVINGILDDEA